MFFVFSLLCNCFPNFKVDNVELESSAEKDEATPTEDEEAETAVNNSQSDINDQNETAAEPEQNMESDQGVITSTISAETEEKPISEQQEIIAPDSVTQQDQDDTGDVGSSTEILEVDLTEEQFVVHVDESDTTWTMIWVTSPKNAMLQHPQR